MVAAAESINERTKPAGWFVAAMVHRCAGTVDEGFHVSDRYTYVFYFESVRWKWKWKPWHKDYTWKELQSVTAAAAKIEAWVTEAQYEPWPDP